MAWLRGDHAHGLTRADFSRGLRGLYGASRELAVLRYHVRQGRHHVRQDRSDPYALRGASVRALCTILACPPLLFLRFRPHRHGHWLALVPLEGCAPRPEPLETDIAELGLATVVRSRGEVDLFTEPVFREHLLGAIRAARRPIILDLREVTYIDGSGLRVLDECWALCRRNGQPLVLIARRTVRRLIEVVGLDKSLTLVDTEERAIELLERNDAP